MRCKYLENWIYLILIQKHRRLAVDNWDEKLEKNIPEEILKEMEDIRFAIDIIEKYCKESE